MTGTEVATIGQHGGNVARAGDFMPIFDFQGAAERRNLMVQFVKEIMIQGVDFGSIPGTDKPTLLKPGAEKLCTFFGLCPEFHTELCIEDWTGAEHNREPLFYYRYKCVLYKGDRRLGEGIGSCNTWEAKYRYRWVPEAMVPKNLPKESLQSKDSSVTEPAFAIDKGETSGKYGKPAEYWNRFREAIANKTAIAGNKTTAAGKPMLTYTIPNVVYRVPNPDGADQVNTCQKMAQKRALVAAILITVNASEFFTQDLEDMDFIDIPPAPAAGASQTAQDESGGAPAATPAAKGADKPPAKADKPAAASKTTPKPPSKEEPPTDIDPQTGEVIPPATSSGPVDPNRDADAAIACKEAATLAELTTYFNKLPGAIRRPGTEAYKAFMARRSELAAKRADGPQDGDQA